MSKNNRRQPIKQIHNQSFLYGFIALCIIGVILGIFALQSLKTDTQNEAVAQAANHPTTSDNPYKDIPGPEDWTDDTPVKIYENGNWVEKTYADVEPGIEFIVGDYLYATTPEKGFLSVKPEIAVSQLSETDRAFDPDNWRMPKPEDVVFVYKASALQGGHELLKNVPFDSKVVFQGKVWQVEYDQARRAMKVSDTGNVFARVTAIHKQVHEGDVLALKVRYESCGKIGLITGSEQHPFYVLEKADYIPMVELEPGMELKTDNGAQATVVELKPLPEAMELYNLTVEHVHNYYIFPSENEPGILVHNAGCGGKIPLKGGGVDLPEGVQWGNVNQIQHYHPPDVPYKQERVANFLEKGYDPTQPIPIMIEADGTWVAVGGNHRLARVKELGYDEVPVRIIYDKSQ
jgi:hypothetical protein